MQRAAALLLTVAAAAATKPHLILMCLDDLGWTDVGYHGSQFKTPIIDGLAKGGIRLERYYLQPVCSPTRSALMTARYPHKTGLQNLDTIAPASHAKLPLDRPTIAEALRDVGYKTHAIGKWHLGMSSWKWTPLGRGFSSYVGYLQGETDYYNRTFLAVGGFDFWRNKTPAYDTVGTYTMNDYQEEAKRVIDNHNPSDPLFMYYAHQCIHQPLQQPDDPKYFASCAHCDGVNRQTLCAMTQRLDDAIGEFVDKLKAKSMWSNTLLWVTSDNGGMVSFAPTSPACNTTKCKDTPASASSNYPLRGSKGTIFEGGVRCISFMAGGFIPTGAAGKIYNGYAQHVDIPATMASLVGADWKGDVDGMDLWKDITSGTSSASTARTEVVINIVVGKESFVSNGDCWKGKVGKIAYSGLIQGDWKILVNALNCAGGSAPGTLGVVDGWWSQGEPHYTHEPPTAAALAWNSTDGQAIHLFNITADPNEEKNVAADNADVVTKLRQRLNELADRRNGYVAPQNNIPYPRGESVFHNNTWKPFLADDEDDL